MASSPPELNVSALGHLPSASLYAELNRRGGGSQASPRPSCGSGNVRPGDYNTPIHVLALFLILVISTFACSFPIIAKLYPRLPIPRHFLFISRHFGTGVLIATAFVHLLPTAFISLTDPCLSPFWNEGYPAMAGFVAMIAVFMVIGVEMIFAIKGAGHVHSHATEYDTLNDGEGDEDFVGYTNEYNNHPSFPEPPTTGDSQVSLIHRPSSFEQRTWGNGDNHNDDEDDDDGEMSLNELEPFPEPDSTSTTPRGVNGQQQLLHHPHDHQRQRSSSQNSFSGNPRKQLVQCFLLEAGILFHSVFIGMALSVVSGPPFIVLLIAITFHQTFEGLALGARISALIPHLLPAASAKPWLMALAYGATTPIGQAIGLGLHNLYDPASATGLLMVGLTNAFSSGLLLFAGLVELLAEDFLSNESYRILKGKRRVEACIAVVAGALLMAFVGAFA